MVDIYMTVVECGYVPFFSDVLSIYSCILLFFSLKGEMPNSFLISSFLIWLLYVINYIHIYIYVYIISTSIQIISDKHGSDNGNLWNINLKIFLVIMKWNRGIQKCRYDASCKKAVSKLIIRSWIVWKGVTFHEIAELYIAVQRVSPQNFTPSPYLKVSSKKIIIQVTL
jgi:hypothetical protein